MAHRKKWKELFASRRKPSAGDAAAAKDKKRKLPGFKGFGRTSSTTQLVELGGTEGRSSTASEDDGSTISTSVADAPAPGAETTLPTTQGKPRTASQPRRPSLLVPKLWYLATHASLALFPFPALYLASDRKLSSVQVGVIMALRPFVSAVFGNAFALVADATRSHRSVLLSTFVAAGVARGLVGLPSLRSFWPLLAAVLLSEAVAAPVIILADASTQRAAESARSDYGRVRLFGALGLGAFSPLNGAIVTRYGNGAGFLAGALSWLLSSSALTAMLPTDGLAAEAARGERPAARRASEVGGGSSCGHLPLPLPSPPAASREEGLDLAIEGEEEGEEVVDDVVDDDDGGTKQELASSSAPIFEVEATAATTARSRLSSLGGGKREAGGDEGRLYDDAVAAAAAALGGGDPRSTPPLSAVPPAAEATARPKRPNSLVVEEAFSEQQHHQQRRSSGAFSSDRVSRASSSAASSTRPLSPAVAAFPSSLPTIQTRKRASSSSTVDGDGGDATSLPLHRKVAAVFGSPQAAVFFATAWALGYGAGTIESWLFVFLEEAPLGASKQLMGITILVTCATEVPAFFYSGRIIQRFGAARVLSAVALVLVARLCGYFALPSVARGRPWAVLPLETLNGITFGCGWAAGTARAASLAPPGLAATAQAAFAAVYGGLGAGLGSLAGGVVRSGAAARARESGGIDKSPTRWVFAAAAAVVALAWTLTTLAEALVARRRRRSRRQRRRRAATATRPANDKKGFSFFAHSTNPSASSAAAAATAAAPTTKQKVVSGPLAA